jgi:flagellar motility protein MotE (MotC chaperone)
MGRVLKGLGLVTLVFLLFVALVHGVLMAKRRHTPETMNAFHDWPVIGGFFPKEVIHEKPPTPEEIREKDAAAWLQDSRNEFQMPAPATTDEVEALVRELKDARSQADAAKARHDAEKADLERARKDLESDRQAVHATGDLIASKLTELNALRSELDRERISLQTTEIRNFKMLAAMYEAMPPEDAAKRLAELEEDTASRLLAKMSDRKAGSILAAMEAPRAVLITKRLQALPAEEEKKAPAASTRSR